MPLTISAARKYETLSADRMIAENSEAFYSEDLKDWTKYKIYLIRDVDVTTFAITFLFLNIPRVRG